ncbi:MAG: LapA family protein [Pseudomonadota bacterium]
MQYIRTIGWVLLTGFVVMFLMMNWGEGQEVRIWPSSDGDNFLVEWPVGVIAIVFFLLGMIPTWLYHRGVKWSLNRRVRSLESAVKSNALANRHEPSAPSGSSSPKPAPSTSDAKPGDTLKPSDDASSE